ncbi:O-antigen translocase [Kaistella carnis]|uniref:O-antigen translocase n=1 Tax=Kaistella carnis TaxID=1241979 RepID=UPI00289C220B|nr:O-antigen translocase [Kaistella carnis]
MIEKLKKVISSDLVKVFSFTGLSTIIKLVTSYVSVKVVAAIIGPSGIALIGQLQNFSSIFTTLGAGGINNGVVKYVSEYKDNETELQKYIRNGFKITVFLSFFFGLFLIVSSSYLSKWILLDTQYNYVFIYFGVSLFLLSINNYFLSILNGFKEFKKFVVINIITSVVGLLFTVTLVLLFHLKGALIATVTYQSVILFITVFFLRKTPWFTSKVLWGKWNKDIIRKYLSYSFMALVSAATVPVSQLLVRGFLIKKYSMDSAGYWEGMNRISGLYLLFVTTSFSVYYLPRLSEIKTEALLKHEIIKTYKIITPIIAGSLILIFLLKNLVINILFTKEFYPMKDLFFWQLLGDFFKIMSWILAFVMVAKSMFKIYIITEILFSTLFVGLSVLFINNFGVIGATQSYCLNYFLYFLVMLFLFRNLLLKNHS